MPAYNFLNPGTLWNITGFRSYINNQLSGIHIFFNANDLKRVFRAIDHVGKKVILESKEIPRLASIDYSHEITKNITAQKRMEGYAPHNLRYAEWKRKQRGRKGFWKLYGDLLGAITVQKQSAFGSRGATAYFSGIPAGILDTGGKSWLNKGRKRTLGPKKYIGWYAYIMEYGGVFSTKKGGIQNHPARPLFERTLQDYEVGGIQDRIDGAYSLIEGEWR